MATGNLYHICRGGEGCQAAVDSSQKRVDIEKYLECGNLGLRGSRNGGDLLRFVP